MPTIWIVNHYAGGPGIGTGWRHWELGRRWAREGVRVRIFTASTRIGGRQCPSRRGESVQDGVSFRFIPTREYQGNGIGRALNMAEFARGSVRAMREAASAGERPDVIIASSPQPFMWPGSARMARLLGAAFVPDIRDAWPESLRDLAGCGPLNPLVMASTWCLKTALQRAATVISPLDNIALHLKEHGFGSAPSIHVPNGVTLPVEKAPVIHPDLERIMVSAKAGNRRVVLYAGAMGIPNALADLMGATRLLSETIKSRLSFVMVGAGTERARLETECPRSAPASFYFLGELDQRLVHAMAAGCDAGLVLRTPHPVYRFGIAPQKFATYMACGLPVICSSTDSSDTVLRHRLGWWNPAGDIRALARSLAELARITDEDLAATSRSCKAYASRELDWTSIAERSLPRLLALNRG